MKNLSDYLPPSHEWGIEYPDGLAAALLGVQVPARRKSIRVPSTIHPGFEYEIGGGGWIITREKSSDRVVEEWCVDVRGKGTWMDEKNVAATLIWYAIHDEATLREIGNHNLITYRGHRVTFTVRPVV